MEDTIKIKVNYNNAVYEVDTKIKNELKEGQYYYLADDYKEPTKVKFMGYVIDNTIGADLIIVCDCLNTVNDKFEYYFTKSLYTSKQKASEAYLNNKFKEE